MFVTTISCDEVKSVVPDGNIKFDALIELLTNLIFNIFELQ